MISDLQEIKKRIFEEERIGEVLEKLGCGHVKPSGRRYFASRPDGDEKRSVQVIINESLICDVQTRGLHFDIYGLVAYILFGATTKEEFKSHLKDSKRWICQQLGYWEYLNPNYIKQEEKDDPNEWLKKLKKKRRKQEDERFNEVIDDSIEDYYKKHNYVMCPHIKWIEEGISYQTQQFFQVGYDSFSERIVFPVHSRYGFFVGVKGRYNGNDSEIQSHMKYLYLHPCDKSIELFNMHRAFKYIFEQKEIIVFEGAKTCMLAWQNGIKNCVSIEGDHLTPYQARILKSLGIRVKIIFAWDKGKDVDFVRNQTKEHFKGRQVFATVDVKDLLEDKDSPLDKGIDVWRTLYTNHTYKVRWKIS